MVKHDGADGYGHKKMQRGGTSNSDEICLILKSLFGGFDQPLSQVFVCSNRCHTPEKVRQILSHELVHLYDHCSAKMDLSNTSHLACTEIR